MQRVNPFPVISSQGQSPQKKPHLASLASDRSSDIQFSSAFPSEHGGITSATINALFSAVNALGVDVVYGLCEQKSTHRFAVSTMDYGCLEKNVDMSWLLALSSEATAELGNVVGSLRSRASDILTPFAVGANRDEEVAIYSYSSDATSENWQIIAKAGVIYYRDKNPSNGNSMGECDSQLMSFTQFLEKGKPDWKPWNLSGLDFSEMDLSNVDLCEVDLSWANLTSTILSGAFLSRANLTGAIMVGANLDNAFLQNANMRQVKLAKASLRGANMAGANLKEAILSIAVMIRVNLSGATLVGADLRFANLTEANMVSADLSEAMLGHATLRGANLSDVHNAQLCAPDTDISGVIWKNMRLDLVEMSSTVDWQRTTITLDLPSTWDEDTLIQRLALLDRCEPGAVLAKINNLSDRSLTSAGEILKLDLMHQVIDSLQNTDIAMVSAALLGVFMSNPIYLVDEEISLFIKERILTCPTMDWLAILANEVGVTGLLQSRPESIAIQDILNGLMRQAQAVLDAFADDAPLADRQKEIVVFASLGLRDVSVHFPSFQIVAKKGELTLKKCRSAESDIVDEIPLMTFAQFLSQVRLYARFSNCLFTLSYLNLNNLNLDGLQLYGADLVFTTFNGTTLRGAHLFNVRMTWVHLMHTNFSDAVLKDIRLKSVQIDATTIFDRACVTLKLPRSWDDEELESQLDHFNNSDSAQLMTQIDLIDSAWRNNHGRVLKIDLMHQVIDSLPDISNASVSVALMNIWARRPQQLYLADKKIRDFTISHLVKHLLNCVDNELIEVDNPLELKIYLDYLMADKSGRVEFMLAHNCTFVQLMRLATETHVDPDMQEIAQQLYAEYIHLGQLKVALNMIEDVTGGDIRLVDGLDKHMTTGADLPAGACFAFFNRVGDTNHILVLDRTQVKSMPLLQSLDADCRWSQITYARGEKTGQEEQLLQENLNIQEVMSVFPLFHLAYQAKLQVAPFKNLLNTFPLNYINESKEIGVLTKDYAPLFERALLAPRMPVNLTGDSDQNTLRKIFEPLFAKEPYRQFNAAVRTEARTIDSAHYAKVMSLFNLTDATDTAKAQTFFCIGAIFGRYASTYHFGAEYDSPRAVRDYAGAWLIAAFELAPWIFRSATFSAEANFILWTTKLVGGIKINAEKKEDNYTAAEFTCAAVLSDIFCDHANREENFRKTLSWMKPQAW